MIKLRNVNEEIIMDYLGGLSLITGVLKSGRRWQNKARELEGDVTKEEWSEKCSAAYFEVGRRGP